MPYRDRRLILFAASRSERAITNRQSMEVCLSSSAFASVVQYQTFLVCLGWMNDRLGDEIPGFDRCYTPDGRPLVPRDE